MGAFILQSTFRELIENRENSLVLPSQQNDAAVTISTKEHLALLAPDLLLSINSAAEAEVAEDIIGTMQTQGWKKQFDSSNALLNVASYNPPMLISVTSTQDKATNWVWRAGHFFLKSSTDGH